MRACLLASLICLAACGGAPAAPTPPPDARLDHVDVFGSSQVTRDQVLAVAGPELAALVDGEGSKQAAIAKIRPLADFAYVDLGVITYFEPRATYVTVDLVDAKDAATRMAFGGAPTGDVPDPDGLLALWREYEEKMWPVIERAAGRTDAECPAWHCITFADPSLAPYLEAFEARVPAQADALARVLAEDRDETDRAAAAYLLAHLDGGDRVVALETAAFRDPSSLVRNNAMRVVVLIAMKHPEIDVPLEPVLAALRFPHTTDRNKAGAILAGIVEHDPSRAKAIVDAVGDVLREMAALKQPNNRDFAVQILAAAE